MCYTVEFIGMNHVVFLNVMALTASRYFALMQLLRLIYIGFTMCLYTLLMLQLAMQPL